MTEDNARKTYYNAVQRVLAVIIKMDQVKKMTPEERKRAGVAKSKRYLELNREKVNAKRRERYARNKEKINAKRRAEYAAGEIQLIETESGDQEQARERLESGRAYNREYAVRKKG